ncbi:MAG: hypothetical protein F6K11_08035 [Leptolyngbya sp. SIO3F4]|nr:hypothetical protein [Leptolyngbya sp. SIO3F4]
MRCRFMLTLVALSLAWLQPAKAEVRSCHSSCEQVAVGKSQWQNYTPRQRAIAAAVAQITSTYYDRTTQLLPITPETVALIVQSIEAEPFETEFVCQQMYKQRLPQIDIYNADARLEELHQQIQTPLNCLF